MIHVSHSVRGAGGAARSAAASEASRLLSVAERKAERLLSEARQEARRIGEAARAARASGGGAVW